MYYINFNQHITFKFGVVLENWPIQKFQPPGSFSSIPIISLIYSAFESGTAQFCSLSDEEWQVWWQDFLTGKSAPAVTTAELLIIEQASLTPESTEVMPTAVSDATPITNQDPTSATNPDPAATAGSRIHATGQTVPTVPALSHRATPTSRDPSIPPVIISTLTTAMNSTSVHGEKCTIDEVDDSGSADIFVNNFGGSDGLIQVMKQPQKKRSDAGVKRGPHKKPTPLATA